MAGEMFRDDLFTSKEVLLTLSIFIATTLFIITFNILTGRVAIILYFYSQLTIMEKRE
ncbi:MAG: hypothetical protein OCU20_04255 [Methanophagales archaeon]|nr:hypothetical protein [Methanophagales archaeon]MCW3137808.1 hypothetical protein [Methanophagales archaeon]MCW7070069.1 hypothetical protein [Methanophagales archaeon]MCW7073093.1 hypothetical protein [Methanophagales archaeon]